MPKILVTGIPQTEKETIIHLVTRDLKRFKIPFAFSDVDKTSNIPNHKNTIILYTLVYSSEYGFRFNDISIFKKYKPDITILLELETKNPEKMLLQEIYRCSLISHIHTGSLKIIKMKRDNIKHPVMEISYFLRKIF